MVGYVPTALLKEKESEYMQEIWKDVVGYEGLYEVSNLGNMQNK